MAIIQSARRLWIILLAAVLQLGVGAAHGETNAVGYFNCPITQVDLFPGGTISSCSPDLLLLASHTTWSETIVVAVDTNAPPPCTNGQTRTITWDPGEAALHGCSLEVLNDGAAWVRKNGTLTNGSFTVTLTSSWDGCVFCSNRVSSSSVEIEVIADDEGTDTGGCASCEGNDLGSASVQNDNVDFKLPLGKAARDRNGHYRDAGYLGLRAEATSGAPATPAALRLPYRRAGVTRVPADEGQPVQQVRVPEGLVTVTTNNTGSVLGVYSNDQIAGGTTNGYTLNANAIPFVTWTLQNPGGNTNTLQITENREGLERAHLYTSQNTNSLSGWRLDRPDSSYGLTLTEALTNGSLKSWELHNADGTLARKTRKTYANCTVGSNTVSLVTEEIAGDGAVTQTTTWTYYTNGPAAGQPRRVIYPNGNWAYFSYDSAGRKEYEYTAYNNSPAPGNDEVPSPASIGCKQTQYFYSGGDEMKYIPSQTIVSLPVQLSENSYTLAQASSTSESRTYTDGRILQRTTTDAASLYTTTYYITIATNPFVGFPESVSSPDGRRANFFYTLATNGSATAIQQTGEPDPSGVILNGEQIETQSDSIGRTLCRIVKSIQDGSVGPILSHITNQYAAVGRDFSTTDLLANRTTSFHYDCCGLATETDPDGVETAYEYDPLHRRVVTEVRRGAAIGVKTTNVLNAAGQVLATWRIGTNGASIKVEGRQFDVLGRPTLVTNALEGVTATYLLTHDGKPRQVTVFPDGGTQTNDYCLDSRLAEVSGTAVSPARYEHGFEPGEGEFKKTIKVSSTGGADEWVKSYTDADGRPVKTLYSDTASSLVYYNDKGQRCKEVDPDGVTRLLEYNAKGELVRNAVAAFGSWQSAIDLANDRIEQTESSVGPATRDSSVTVRRTVTSVYPTVGDSAPVAISTNEVSTDGLRTWNFTPSGLYFSSTAFGATGYRYTTNTAPDGTYTVDTSRYGLPQSSVRYDALNNQLSAVNYAHDSFDRKTASTDARNGTTTTTWNNADLVESITTPSPGNGQSAQTATLYYDKSLRTTNTVQPDQASVLTSFYPSGLTRQQSGARTYPVGYSYDAQNRLKTMTNWSSFPSAGARVTTWNYNSQRGWLASKQYPLPSGEGQGEGPSYGYTPAGRLDTRTWARGIITTSGYNYAGQLSSIEYSDDTPSVAFTHDRLGRLSQISNPASQITRAHDQAGNLLSESYTGGPLHGFTLTNQYDQFNRRTNLSLHYSTTPLLHHSFSFSPTSGRLQTVTDGTNSATYSCLANSGLVEQIAFSNATSRLMTTTKQWDYLNRLESISSACSAYSAVSFSYGYNNANQRTNATLADGSQWSFSYDSLGQVTSGSKRWPDNTPVAGQQFCYTFDDIGNRRWTTNNTHIAAYTNNNLNQITSRDIPGFAQVIGSANSNATVSLWADNGTYAQTSRKGNYFVGELPVNNSTGAVWLTITNLAVLRNGTNADYVASAIGRQLVQQTPQIFQHDADGNLTNDARWTYSWDVENRLTDIESGAGVPPAAQCRLDFAYDWQSRRTQKIVYTNDGSGFVGSYTNRFLYDGWNLIAEFAPDGTLLRSHLWGTDASGTMQGAGGVGGLLATIIHTGPYAGTYFPLYDGNHNIMAYIRASDGQIVARFEYGPFGELVRASGPLAREFNFLFSTKYFDWETALYYYGYRYYDPSTGRWLSRDRIAELGGKNIYAFVSNQPSRRIDVVGLMAIQDSGFDVSENRSCRYSIRFELLPKTAFDFLQKLHEVGVTWVKNSEEMLGVLNSRVKKYDPEGNCCKGECIGYLAISGHGNQTGAVTLSTDASELFDFTVWRNLQKILERGGALTSEQQAEYERNRSGLAFLTQLKGKLCRRAKVSIVQCQSEYPSGSGQSLKGELQTILGSDIQVETFVGNCQYWTPLWPIPGWPIEL